MSPHDEKLKEIRVGTSGYSFEDWRGVFYPEKVAKGKMLDHYVKHFNTVEINSTYYRIPHPAVMYNLVKKAPEGFDFVVKVPQSFTHKRDKMADEVEAFSEAIKPFEEAGNLSGLLAQYPYSFKFNPTSLDHISRCRDAVDPNPLFVEFRHDSWVNREMYDRLRGEGIGYVCVDEPQLRGLLKPDLFATTDTGYVRLHGRNADQWWTGGNLRYDYSYSDEELNEWIVKIRKIRDKVSKLYVYFNNCHVGQAVGNAQSFLKMLAQEPSA
jgi:uncharacterized protein YecE (DUF72 family)